MFSHQRQGEPPYVAVVPGWRVTVEKRIMKKTALLFGVGASLILAAGAANAAGSCGAEVADLQQKLGTEDSANATIGATDPGVQQPDPGASTEPTDLSSSSSTSTTTTTDTNNGSSVTTADNTGANATIGATDPGVQQPDGGGSDAVAENNASGSTATMPSTGTVTDASRVGELNTAAGGHAEAITALKKAQMAADAGDEGACMTELGTAKAALGVQ